MLSLARWRNALIAAGGVLVGAWWARGEMGVAVLWCMLAAIGVTAAANAWNDIADVEIDRVVHPTRPLVRGALTRRQAGWFAGVAALAGAAARDHPEPLPVSCRHALQTCRRTRGACE